MEVKRNALYLGVSLALSGSVVAQQETEATEQESANNRQVEEIIVTATKRSQDIQSVSVAVTALGADDIAKGGIEDVSRIENLVPGMSYGQSGSEVRLAIRGTRTNNVGSEAEQVVGIFEDGVYVPTTTQALGSYVDLERIEVLRGPQGTLYGRNTFGGTINIHTRAPEFDEVSGYVQALAGTYDRRKVEGAVNLPISDTLAVRLAGLMDQRDGYIENTYVDGPSDDLNDADNKYFRASLRWQPTESLDVIVRAGQGTQEGNGSAIWGYQQIGAYDNGNFLPGHQFMPADATAATDQGPWKVSRNMASSVDLESSFFTVQAEWDADWVVIKYTGNQTNFEGSQTYDPDYSDGGSLTDSGFVGWNSDQDTFSHEIQFTSPANDTFEWLGGAYYFEQAAGWNWLERVGGVTAVPHWDNQGDYVSTSLGVFANGTLHMSEATRLVGGIRYAEDTKQQRDPLDWSVWPPVPMKGQGSKGDWNDILYKAAVEHDLNDDQMLYGQVSTGYRAGGINFVDPVVPLTYEPETVTAWEVGYKSTWLDRTMVFNAAVYLNQYRDMQAQSFVVQGTGVTEYTENGGELDSMGFEAELSWNPTDQLSLSGSLSIMQAEFGKYEVSKVQGLGNMGGRQDLNDPASLLNLEGFRPALAPELTLGLQASYDIYLGDMGTLTPYAQTYYSGDYYAYDINVEGAKQDSFTRTDLRLIWASPDASWEVQGYVMNLENEAQLNRVVVFNPSQSPSIASLQANWSNPRTAGVSVNYNF